MELHCTLGFVHRLKAQANLKTLKAYVNIENMIWL